MAKTSTQEKSVEQIAASTGTVKLSASELAALKSKGTVSQGRGEILILEVGEAAGPFKIGRTILGVTLSEGSAPVDVYTCTDKSGTPWRLPVGAIFNDKMRELNVKEGDSIVLERNPDIKKEKGKGKGTMMKDWVVIKL